jgi:Core-2/I-Branching enzyme
MSKIALLFLLIDNPNFPNIWDEFLKGNEDKYTIYIHPKYPVQHTWRPKNIIKSLKETGWGFITRAYIELLKEAYEDKNNYKFITISESCVPIKPFNILYDDMMKDNLSYIKRMEITKYDCIERIKKHINEIKNTNIIIPDKYTFIKHYARFCLSRYHVNKLLIANKQDKMEFFNTMHVGDEFFLTLLYPLDKYKDIAITFDDWEYVKKLIYKINHKLKKYYKIQETSNKNLNEKIVELQKLKQDIAKNPKTITKLTKEDLKQMKTSNSYFYRKFSKDSNIKKYINKFI